RGQHLHGFRIVQRARDRAQRDQRIALEIHLGDQALRETAAEDREVDVRRTPVVRTIRPRIRTRLNGAEPVAAFLVGDRTAAAAKVRVEGSLVAFRLVAVAATGIGLPVLDQCTRDRATIFVKDTAVDDDARTDRTLAWAGVVVDQVVVELTDDVVAETRTGVLRNRALQRQQGTLRRAHDRGLVPRRVCLGVPVEVALEERTCLRQPVGAYGIAHCSLSLSISSNVCLTILIAWLARGTPA